MANIFLGTPDSDTSSMRSPAYWVAHPETAPAGAMTRTDGVSGGRLARLIHLSISRGRPT